MSVLNILAVTYLHNAMIIDFEKLSKVSDDSEQFSPGWEVSIDWGSGGRAWKGGGGTAEKWSILFLY